MLSKKFSAKILLFGEYTILNGSKALAVPYDALSGNWMFGGEGEAYKLSQDSLKDFVSHNHESYIDHKRLSDDVEKGLWFDANIPHGYGLGSSGALIAAIFDSYGKKHGSFFENRKTLAGLEGHFHGSSSGIDPLVSLIQKPLLIHSFDEVEILERTLKLNGFFLVNSGRPRQTGPLVSLFKEKLKDPQFKHGCAEVLSREVNFALQGVLSGDKQHLFHHLWLISKFQWEYFPEMIPTQMRGLWSRGLESGEFILKLCGAGGGGFILGYSDKLSSSELKTVFDHHELRMLS